MLLLIAKRLLWLPIMLWVLITASFFIMRSVPGDPFQKENQKIPETVRQYMMRKYHLDEPIWVQYGLYLKGALPCDWGMRSDDHVLVGFDSAVVSDRRRRQALERLADELGASVVETAPAPTALDDEARQWQRLIISVSVEDREHPGAAGTQTEASDRREPRHGRINYASRAVSVLFQMGIRAADVPGAVGTDVPVRVMLDAEDRDEGFHLFPAWPDLGITLSNESVTQKLLALLPRSMALGMIALSIAIAIGLSAGVIAGIRQNTTWDYGAMSMALLGISVPNFVFAFVFIVVFSFMPDWVVVGEPARNWGVLMFLGFLPLCFGAWASLRGARDLDGRAARFFFALGVALCLPALIALGAAVVMLLRWQLGERVALPVAGWGESQHVIMPAIALGLPYAAYVARLTRTGMIEQIRQDYVRTAHAKGLSEEVVVIGHTLRLAALPVISFLGPAAAGILTGSLVIERIFNVQGFGAAFINAALNRDYALFMGGLMVYATLLILFNLIVDVLYGVLDPRVRFGGNAS